MKSYEWTDKITGKRVKIALESDGELSWDFTHLNGESRIAILVREIWELRECNISLESAVYDLQERTDNY